MDKEEKHYDRYNQLCVMQEDLDIWDVITPDSIGKESRIGIFGAYQGTDPEEFETVVMPSIETKYKEYFDIFQHPILYSSHAKIRFRSILGPERFQKRIEDMLKEVKNTEEQRVILLHLIAEVCMFRLDFRYNIFEEKPKKVKYLKENEKKKKNKKYGKQRVSEILKEIQLQRRLKHLFYTKDFNDLSLEKISFKFKGKPPLTIKEPSVLIYFIGDYIRAIDKAPDLPSELKDKRRSGPDNFSIQFRNRLIIALYNFLVKDNLCKVSKAGVKLEAVKFISDFLELCNIEIYSAYESGEPTLYDNRLKVIENTIRRAQ